MGRSKETMARLFGFGIPRGGSKLPMKSDIWLKVMNCVACGSNLDNDCQSLSLQRIKKAFMRLMKGLPSFINLIIVTLWQ